MPFRLLSDPDSPFVICWHVVCEDEIVGTVYYDDGDTSQGGPPRPSGWAVFANASSEHMGLPVADHLDVADAAVTQALRYLRHKDAMRATGRTLADSLRALPWKAPEAAEARRLTGERLQPLDMDLVQGWLEEPLGD